MEDYGYDDLDVSSWFGMQFVIKNRFKILKMLCIFSDGTETDFPRIKLKYIRELGRGWFGKVRYFIIKNEFNFICT